MAGVTALVGPRIHVPLFAQRGRVDSLGTRQGELYPGELGGRLFQGEEHNAWTPDRRIRFTLQNGRSPCGFVPPFINPTNGVCNSDIVWLFRQDTEDLVSW